MARLSRTRLARVNNNRIQLAFLVMTAIFFLWVSSAAAAVVQTQLTSGCWTIGAGFQAKSAEPGTDLGLVLEIKTLIPTYDLHIDVASSPSLTITGPQNGATVTIDELDAGNVTNLSFSITFPKTLQEGQNVQFTVTARSHNDPPGSFGIRLPWDTPECTAVSPASELSVSIVTKPNVTFESITVPSQVQEGNEFTVAVTIINNGTGTATNLRTSLNLPSVLQIVNSTDHINGESLSPGQQASAQWVIKPVANGTYRVTLTVQGGNIQSLTVSREILVTPPQPLFSGTMTPAFMLPQLVFIPRNLSLLFIIGLILAGIVEYRQGHIGRVAVAGNVFLQWQIFFGYWTHLPVWFQWYLNLGTVIAVIALLTYFLHRSLPGTFYDLAVFMFGSFAVIVSLVIGAFLGVPLW